MPKRVTHAGERTSRALSRWLVATVCIIFAGTARAAMSGRRGGSAQCRPIASWQRNTAFQSDAAIFNPADTRVTSNCAMPWRHARVNHQRMRTGRFFQRDFPSDSSIAGDDCFQLSLWGVNVTPREALLPIIFLSAETTRGPPRAGTQSPRLFDGARDRPAPHPCASPPLSEFLLHESWSARNTTCPHIPASLAGKVSALGVGAGLSTKHSPTVYSQGQPEIQPSLAHSRNITKESYHEHEPGLCNASESNPC